MLDTAEITNEHYKDDIYWYLRDNGSEYFSDIAKLCVGKTLDIGCGEAHLRHKIKSYIGFDVSDFIVSKIKDERVFVGDLNKLPEVRDVESVVLCGVLFYLTYDNQISFLQNIITTYKPKLIVIADPIVKDNSKLPFDIVYHSVKEYNLTDKNLKNGTKGFINKRQMTVIKSC